MGFFGDHKPEEIKAAMMQNEASEKAETRSVVQGIMQRIKEKGKEFRNLVGADYKVRCSSIGTIMTEPRGKSPMTKWVEAKEKLSILELKMAEKKEKQAKTIEEFDRKISEAEAKVAEYTQKIEDEKTTESVKKKTEQTRNNRKKYIEDTKAKREQSKVDWGLKKEEMKTEIKAQTEEVEYLSNDKDKIHLSQGCINELKKWLKQNKYRRRRELDTKHTIKGKEMEDEAIAMYHRVAGYEGEKNDKRLYSPWMTGEFDDMPKDKSGKTIDVVADMKASWDIETFPLYKNEPPKGSETPNKGYWSQIQGYFHLVTENGLVHDIDKLEGELVYALQSSSEEQIEKEIKRRCWAKGVSRLEPEEEEKIFYNMWFDDIPEEDRVKRYYFKPDWEFVDKVKARVELCRRYIDEEILPKHSMNVRIKS